LVLRSASSSLYPLGRQCRSRFALPTTESELVAFLDDALHPEAVQADEAANVILPPLFLRTPRNAMANVADYLNDVCRTDINRVDGVNRDPARVRRLLRRLARNVATHVAMTTWRPTRPVPAITHLSSTPSVGTFRR